MNSLSWMIYAADLAGSVSSVGTAISVGAGVGGIIAVIAAAAGTDMDNIYRKRGEEKPCLKAGWSAGKGFFKVSIIAAIAVTPIPSKQTMYAIAASESGSQVLNSPTADKAIKALNAWLDKQAKP